jgi:hypothetical protein
VILILLFSFSLSFGTEIGFAIEIGDQFSVAGYELQILEIEGKCKLFLKNKDGTSEVDLGPKPPCRFLRYKGKVQVYSKEDGSIDAIMIVAGTPEEDPKLRDPSLQGFYCASEVQGIAVKRDGLYLSQFTEGNKCVIYPDLGYGKKLFFLLADEARLIGPLELK